MPEPVRAHVPIPPELAAGRVRGALADAWSVRILRPASTDAWGQTTDSVAQRQGQSRSCTFPAGIALPMDGSESILTYRGKSWGIQSPGGDHTLHAVH